MRSIGFICATDVFYRMELLVNYYQFGHYERISFIKSSSS
uniref:Uncharacterized protein n=1 Tax=Arundo donax TaxID=35708 RepID=A0A0A8ZY36_ARUDO